ILSYKDQEKRLENRIGQSIEGSSRSIRYILYSFDAIESGKSRKPEKQLTAGKPNNEDEASNTKFMTLQQELAQLVERETVVGLLVDISRSLVQIWLAGPHKKQDVLKKTGNNTMSSVGRAGDCSELKAQRRYL
ncbi:7831_t:CDS:2, partial [Cetraspora pellucida]